MNNLRKFLSLALKFLKIFTIVFLLIVCLLVAYILVAPAVQQFRYEAFKTAHPGCANPYQRQTGQIGDARNAQRKSDITSILNAVLDYNKSISTQLVTTIPETETEICNGSGAVYCQSLVDLSPLIAGKVLIGMPSDPATYLKLPSSPQNSTLYTIRKDSSNILTVSAPYTVHHCPNEMLITISRSIEQE